MNLPIDELSDEALEKLNKAHAWVTMTEDSKGRRLGHGERVFEIPDFRVRFVKEHFELTGKSVVEFGCLEGAHTVALSREAREVTAVEGRESNLEKARIRCNLYGVAPIFVKADVEAYVPPAADFYFHCGVLYHLKDPVTHLLRISKLTNGLFLDTHYTKEPTGSYRCSEDGKMYPCFVYGESPAAAKAGLQTIARWLRLGDILEILRERFQDVEVLRDEKERNGHRVSIVAKRVGR